MPCASRARAPTVPGFPRITIGALSTWFAPGARPEPARRHRPQGYFGSRLHDHVGWDQVRWRGLSDRADRVLPLGLRHRAARSLAGLAGRARRCRAHARPPRPYPARHHRVLRHVLGLHGAVVPATVGRRRDRLRGAADHGGARGPRAQGACAGVPLVGRDGRLRRRADHAVAAPAARRLPVRRSGRPDDRGLVRTARSVLHRGRHDPGAPS